MILSKRLPNVKTIARKDVEIVVLVIAFKHVINHATIDAEGLAWEHVTQLVKELHFNGP